MSLQYLGITHFPTHHRQFLSPARRSSSTTFSSYPRSAPTSPAQHRRQDQHQDPDQDTDSESDNHNNNDDDVTQDNKDVLLERLNDLITRLSRDDYALDNTAVTVVHSEVDRIERYIRAASRSGSANGRGNGKRMRRKRLDEVAVRENESYWGPPLSPLSPTRSISGVGRMSLERSVSAAEEGDGGSFGSSPLLFLQQRGGKEQHMAMDMSPERAAELAEAAEELVVRLSNTVKEFHTRKEESDHIHDLLVKRAEKAAKRILLLEYRIAEMEDDFEANQSELKFLRIQLQAIEAQCSPYIPQDEDHQELSDSIMNWKIDWEDINRRARARRRNCQSAGDSDSSLGLSVVTTGGLEIISVPSQKELSQSVVKPAISQEVG